MTHQSPLRGLGQWFAMQANGEWEHENEIRIVSLDNPGWSVSIPLSGTILEAKAFEPFEDDRSSAGSS